MIIDRKPLPLVCIWRNRLSTNWHFSRIHNYTYEQWYYPWEIELFVGPLHIKVMGRFRRENND
jgi:hypothetical protein